MINKKEDYISGHRARLRQKLLRGEPGSLCESEILELILFAAKTRGDVKPLAKKLLLHFKTLDAVIYAPYHELKKINMTDTVISTLKANQEIISYVLKTKLVKKPIIENWISLIEYCQVTLGRKEKEEFHVIFLDNKNMVIKDEVLFKGTINLSHVYPREIVKRALELHSVSIILLHNHPSGNLQPSKADIAITKEIKTICSHLSINLYDHLIITKESFYSLKNNLLI